MDIRRALAALDRGDVVGLPTDTVYGIAVAASNPAAIDALYRIKGRPAEKAIPLLVASTLQAERIVEVDNRIRSLLRRYWPGGLTVVLPRAGGAPPHLGQMETGTVAVRMPAHLTALELIEESGPLAVTSANPSGMPSPTDADAAEAALGPAVSLYLPGAGGGIESTVIDATTPTLRTLRHGAIPPPR